MPSRRSLPDCVQGLKAHMVGQGPPAAGTACDRPLGRRGVVGVKGVHWLCACTHSRIGHGEKKGKEMGVPGDVRKRDR